MPSEPAPAELSLREVLGGREAAVDASVPVAAFVVAWALADGLDAARPVLWGTGAALATGVVVAVNRLARGGRPRAVLLGLLGVTVAALVALRTGRAVDFFLLQLVGNAASALVWAVSIAVRWPLLGVVVGVALGQRTRWRRDPDLLRGYQRASWVWVGQYVVRLLVFVPLWANGAVVALGAARLVLTWPLVALCIAVSWPVLRSALPPGHPGIRHPRDGS
ncbi:MAG TPA: DUF3159 domain-containing protein [Pseudonocardia sp.]|nr:DUF3159 domain-containing protein [Pseudonocardia sp.]